MSWADTRLKHLCVDSGQYGLNISADEYVDYGIRLIRTSDITPDGNLSPTEDGVFIDVELEKRHCLKAGDLLMSRSGTLGRSFIVPSSAEGCTFAGFLVRFRPRDDVDPRFIYYSTRSERFQGIVKSEAVSSTIQNFNAERYSNIPMCAPPLEEQRRIADFLDAETSRIDQLVAFRTRQIQLLQDRWRSQLSEHMDRLLTRFDAVRLRHLMLGIEQGWSPQCEDRLVENDQWGVVKAGCVNGGLFDPKQHKALPEGIDPRVEYRLKRGDLLMSRASGSAELIGSVGIVQDLPYRLLLCDKVYRINLDRRRAHSAYVAFALRSHRVREHIKNGISGAEGMANNLPTSTVKDCVIAAAPLGIQRQVASELALQHIDSNRVIDKVKASVELLSERRQALITAAVTGQFDVSTASGRNATQGV